MGDVTTSPLTYDKAPSPGPLTLSELRLISAKEREGNPGFSLAGVRTTPPAPGGHWMSSLENRLCCWISCVCVSERERKRVSKRGSGGYKPSSFKLIKKKTGEGKKGRDELEKGAQSAGSFNLVRWCRFKSLTYTPPPCTLSILNHPCTRTTHRPE